MSVSLVPGRRGSIEQSAPKLEFTVRLDPLLPLPIPTDAERTPCGGVSALAVIEAIERATPSFLTLASRCPSGILPPLLEARLPALSGAGCDAVRAALVASKDLQAFHPLLLALESTAWPCSRSPSAARALAEAVEQLGERGPPLDRLLSTLLRQPHAGARSVLYRVAGRSTEPLALERVRAAVRAQERDPPKGLWGGSVPEDQRIADLRWARAALVRLGADDHRAYVRAFIESTASAGAEARAEARAMLLYIGDRRLARALIPWLSMSEADVADLFAAARGEQPRRACEVAIETIQALGIELPSDARRALQVKFDRCDRVVIQAVARELAALPE